MAARMRSRLSSMVLFAMPTILRSGRPLALSHSTVTRLAVVPVGIAENDFEIVMAGV